MVQSLPITKLLAEITGNVGAGSGTCSRRARSSPILMPLIVFFALQRFFVRGLLAGATKG